MACDVSVVAGPAAAVSAAGDVRVLLAADRPPRTRAIVRIALEIEDGFITVVADAATADGAVRLAEELQPDLILLDVVMPGTASTHCPRCSGHRLGPGRRRRRRHPRQDPQPRRSRRPPRRLRVP